MECEKIVINKQKNKNVFNTIYVKFMKSKEYIKNRFKPWFAHFRTIKNNPFKFVMWIFISIIISLSSLWLPLLIGLLISHDVSKEIFEPQPLIFFSIVLICDALLTSVCIEGSYSNKMSTTIRGLSIVIAIIALVIFSSFSVIGYFSVDKLATSAQFICLCIAIIVSIYIYGLREKDWEKDVSTVTKKQDQEVNNMSEEADSLSKTPEGENI